MSQKLSAFLIMAILLVSTVSVFPNFAMADDDKNKTKKPKTLQDFCSTLDDKNSFPALVCAAIFGITDSIQNLQDQINQMQFTAQRCPPGQEMVGINVNRQIICENPNFQSVTSVIVTINPTSIQVPPPHVTKTVSLASIELSPNAHVIVDDGLGHQILTGTSDNNGAFSFSNLPLITSDFPPGTFTLRVTDENGRTGSAILTLTTPPPPPTCTPPQVLNPSTNTCFTPATVTLTPSSGPAGTSVTLTASGLTPSSIVTVTVMGITVGSGTSDGTGSFTFGPITVPPTLPAGNIPVTVTDSGGISGSAMFLKT